jgi:hypothetical protein
MKSFSNCSLCSNWFLEWRIMSSNRIN